MSNITLYEKIDNPTAMQSVREMGVEYAKSGFFGITNPSQGLVMAVTCVAEGITPVEFGKVYHIIEGRLSMKADAMQAKFQESGGRITWKQSDAVTCEAVFSHKDYCPNGVTIATTYQEFVDSGVAISPKTGKVKDVWRKHPRQMLRARAISEGVRMVNPSIVAGYYTPEEVGDFDSGHAAKPKGNPLPPRKKTEPEPKETEATVVNDVVEDESTDAFLFANEEAVNLYLAHLKWVSEGQTWRDLSSGHRETIDGKLSSFLKKAKEYADSQKEAVNV